MTYVDKTAHKLVDKLCVTLAQELYEELASNDEFYRANRNRIHFVRKTAPSLMNEAVKILGSLLNDPELSTTDKDTIHEALVLQAMIPKGATTVTQR